MSVGTVWRVGGLAPISGVPDGRGRLVGSGTNAPLYTTSFSIARPKAQDDKDKHESRLAEALELDRVGRVLEFREQSSLLLEPITTGKNKGSEIETKTAWRGTEWIMGGPDQSTQLQAVLSHQ